jgi:hypothetical protein
MVNSKSLKCELALPVSGPATVDLADAMNTGPAPTEPDFCLLARAAGAAVLQRHSAGETDR